MSTNARIGYQATVAAPVKSIYLHWDGYPSGAGRTLLDHWTNGGRILELLDLGDLSVLGKIIGEKHDFDRHMGVYGEDTYMTEHTPQGKGWCLAYGRDRGEEDVSAKVHPFADWPSYGQEWEYLFDATASLWWGRSVGWGEHPHGPWTPLEDLVRQDEEETAKYLAAQQS